MRHQPKPSGGLNAHDQDIDGVIELVETWRGVVFIEFLRQNATIVRDTMFDDVTRNAGITGESRGLSTRLAHEFGLTDGGMKQVKTRARKRAANRDLMPDRQAEALLAAMRAAVQKYEQMMKKGKGKKAA